MEALTGRVDDAVYNYHSANDNVLRYLYAAAQGGQSAAGRHGFEVAGEKLENVDVSAEVHGHSHYHAAAELR